MDILPILVGGGVGAVLAVWWGRRRGRERGHRYAAGASVRIPASIRGYSHPYPRRWRTGTLIVGKGRADWLPRWFARTKQPVVLPTMDVVVKQVRDVHGRECGA